jgi:hypothetical protein
MNKIMFLLILISGNVYAESVVCEDSQSTVPSESFIVKHIAGGKYRFYYLQKLNDKSLSNLFISYFHEKSPEFSISAVPLVEDDIFYTDFFYRDVEGSELKFYISYGEAIDSCGYMYKWDFKLLLGKK